MGQKVGRRSHRSWLLLLVSLALCLSFYYQIPGHEHNSSCLNDIFNRTLGFQRIHAISFPERSDKRDALVLASSFGEFDIEWADAVSFESIAPKAAPVNWDYEKRTNGALGCWRAHMNVLQGVIHDKVETALILEDDSDFDISIKQQLYQFASGTRALQNSTESLSSPYGNDWDFLWLGHCKLGPANDQSRFYVIDSDPTVAPIARRNGKWMNDHIPPDILMEDNRVVFKANNGGLCTYAYAVTYKGARKILASMSITPRDDVLDMNFRRMCQGKFGVPFDCYGSYPTLFGSHRAAGPKNRDSDVNDKTDKWHDEYTFDVVYSTMQNVGRLASGDPFVSAQWPQEVKREIKLANERISGVGQLKEIDLAALPKQELPGINR